MPDTPLPITLGSPLHSADTPAFTVAEVCYPGGASYPPHAHDRTYVSFVLRGAFAEHVGGDSAVARSATVVIMPAATVHRNAMGSEGARSLIIALHDEFERRLCSGGRLAPRWRQIERGLPLRLMLRAYTDYRLSRGAEWLSIEETLHALADALRGGDDHHARAGCADSAARLLRDRIAEPLRLESICAATSRDPAYLCRAFRKRFGCTMGEYLRQLRTKHAADRIASSDAPLSEIALACGFADQSHLTRVFKAHFGLAPRQYRRFARAR